MDIVTQEALESSTSEPLLRNGMTAMLTREDPSQPETVMNWDRTDGAVVSVERTTYVQSPIV